MLDSLMIWVRSTLDEMHGREGMVPDIPGIGGYWLLATGYSLLASTRGLSNNSNCGGTLNPSNG